jgi:thiamine pyrophosphate-dependent acetolactate synthase large subunit-like protein
MKELVRQYLDHGISRRQLMSGLAATGLTTVAAKAVAQSLEQVAQAANVPPAAVRDVTGTGGKLFVEQLKSAGVEYIFFNPSTGDAPIFDALVDEPSISLIKGVQEGAVVAMADGYARATGKVGVVIVADIGLPNAMTQMVNSFKDNVPLMVVVASFAQETQSRDTWQEIDRRDSMTQPITKWYWQALTTTSIPEVTRRALKFASTPPSGPVYMAIPGNILQAQATAQVWDQAKFDVPMKIRPDKDDVEKAARMLIEAKNPLMAVGDEITWCRGEKEVAQLAELLGLPVAGQSGGLGFWSKPFPTRSPLYLGPVLRQMRFPGQVDVLLNMGFKYGEVRMAGAKLISVRHDPSSLARATPVDLGMVADLKLAAADLIDAVKSLATKERLSAIAAERTGRVQAYTQKMAELRANIARDMAEGAPINLQRLGVELETALDKDAYYVGDVDSGKTMDPFMNFGGSDKVYVGTSPNVLGWGMAGAFGVKLAKPDKQVVSVVGDGSFLFSGPAPLWSHARYKAPIMTVVLNNRSYNNERNRIWASGGQQYKTGRDMTCYLGDPDVNYAKTAEAYGVEGEQVKQPSQIKPALARARKANEEGRPYLLDVDTARDGIGAATAWHPPFSVAAKRTRKV